LGHDRRPSDINAQRRRSIQLERRLFGRQWIPGLQRLGDPCP
jgi:hypothetical protein